MEEGEIEETQQQQEPLFKPLCDSCQHEGAKAPNPKYEDGKVLPKKLRCRFLQEAKPCVPLEEIDPYFRNKQTFIVIGRWGTIHRFSCNAQGYLTLGPNNPFRRFAIFLQTNWIFSTLILATLLLNIVALIKTQNYEIMSAIGGISKRSWVVDAMYIVNYVCLAIYCFELAVKVIARGLIGDSFTCFRDPWTWLDVLVIWTGFCTPRSFILQGRAIIWCRLFKIIPLVPSIRQACRLSWKAVKQLGGMLILMVLLLWFFSLLGSQIYMGTLTQKCVKRIPDRVAITDEIWMQHTMNMSNWHRDYDFTICGNASGARPCPEDYVCLQGIGSNPDFGYTNFDNVLWSLLSVIRIGSEDFTEEIFRQLLSANGPWHILFFEAIFFLITFPMGCLFFAILGYFFTESKAPSELELEEITGLAELHDFDNGQGPESLVIKAKIVDAPDEEVSGFRKALHGFIFHDWIKNILVCVIIIDIIGIAADYYRIQDYTFDYYLYILVIPYIVFILYTLEFLVKIIALGPPKYFRNRWNHLDLIVLLTFFLEIQSYVGQYTGYMLAPIRLLKLIQYWPSLRMIFGIYYKTIKNLWGWVLYSIILFAFLVFIAPFELGQSEMERFRGRDKFTPNDLPRWTYVDFWHSFRMVVRMQIAEWVETLWVVLPYTGAKAFVYYLVVNLTGALLISFLLVGVVYTTVSELQNTYDPTKDRGLRLLLRRAFGLMYFPIQRIQPKELIMKNGSDTLAAAENGAADESETKAKPEGKIAGARRKTSIVAESTGQLRKVMQDCTEHWAYKIACSGIIIVASLAMVFETKDSSEDLQIVLFIIEIMFTVAFFVIAVYELLAYGFKDAVMDRGWLFDALIVLENILNLFIYQFSVTGSFRVGLFCIRSFRPLMLIARIDWLKAPFRGIKGELKTFWETILAILFIWLFFDTFGVHWLAGLYYRCIDPTTGEEIRPTLNKVDCLSHNYTWENSDYNFDNSGDGFLSMVFLVSRMGWVSIINDGSDAIGHGFPRQRDVTKFWLIYFIVFVLCGGLGAMGILFSYVFNRFREDKGYNIILTEKQANSYAEAKSSKGPRDTCVTLEEEYIPPPDAPCLNALFNLVTNQKFDGCVMLLIILDNVLLSLEHYHQSQSFEIILTSLRLGILVLFIAEMIIKMIAWGKHYFRNGWNYLDLLVIIMGLLELVIADFVHNYLVSPTLIRMLRLLRIFRFLLAKNCGLDALKVLFSAAGNIKHAFGNLLLLQLTIMWAFSLLGVYLFDNVMQTGALSHDMNFETFRNAFWVLALLLGFPCLDGLYSALSNEHDCSVKDPETTTCGDKTAAILYIGLYAGLTFMVLLNMYAVFISEIISEIGRIKKESTPGDEEVPLQDVSTENGGQNGGELSDAGSEAEAEPEEGGSE